ncbi:hypothetical protein [Bradyrhizobium sp. USDA 3256]
MILADTNDAGNAGDGEMGILANGNGRPGWSYDGFWVTRSDQAARTSAVGTTSIPSANFTPDITFGN